MAVVSVDRRKANKLLAVIREGRKAESLFDSLGLKLTSPQFEVLERIAFGSVTMGEVAQARGVTPAVATGIVDRLERRGLVLRVDSTLDRRRTLVQATELGYKVLSDIFLKLSEIPEAA